MKRRIFGFRLHLSSTICSRVRYVKKLGINWSKSNIWNSSFVSLAEDKIRVRNFKRVVKWYRHRYAQHFKSITRNNRCSSSWHFVIFVLVFSSSFFQFFGNRYGNCLDSRLSLTDIGVIVIQWILHFTLYECSSLASEHWAWSTLHNRFLFVLKVRFTANS